MSLRSIIEKGKAIFVSPYTGLSIVLGIHIARHLTLSKSTVFMFSEYPIPSSTLAIIEPDRSMHIKFLDSLSSVVQNSTLIAILSYVDIETYNLISSSTSNFYIFTNRLSMSRPRYRHGLVIYRVKRVGENIYLIRSNYYRCLIKVSGGSIEEVEIPFEVTLISEELKELMSVYGSVKASVFLKYFSRKYGYSRDKCLELIRKAEALGLVKYVGGYLLAV